MRGIEQYLQVDAATLGALKYAGTWNASTNTPTLASGVGTQGQYYVVSVAGSTNLDGETNWQVGDWAVFNGSVWQKVDGGSTGLLSTLTVTGNTYLATTSGNVGIGTTSPASQFNMYNATNATATIQGDAIVTLAIERYSTNSIAPSFAIRKFRGTLAAPTAVATGDVIANLNFVAYGGTTQRVVSQIRSFVDTYVSDTDISSYLTFSTSPAGSAAATERMRIDSAGNLGLGVTPSAWGSAIKAIQMGFAGSTAISGRTDAFQSNFTLNAYDTGSNTWVYLQSTTANRYSMVSGQHQWFTAPSGTAGNAISFTQAMTLDASGNLGVGTSSPAGFGNTGKLAVQTASSTNGIVATFANSGATGAAIQLFQTGVDVATIGMPANSGGITFAPSGTTERMRLDASGNLGIGTSSPSYKLDVAASAARIRSTSAYSGLLLSSGDPNASTRNWLVASNWNAYGDFALVQSNAQGGDPISAGTTRLTVDASGNVGIGTTSPTSALEILRGAGAGAEISIRANNVAKAGEVVISQDSGNAAYVYNRSNQFMSFGTNNAERMRITSTGDVGIGTSSPAAKFEVANTSGNVAAILRSSNSGYSELYFADVADNAASAISYEHATNILRLYNGGSVRVYLDASGNLGLGVTPQTWGSNYKVFEVAGASAGVVSAYVNNLNLGTNIRNDNTNWIYTFTGQNATRYEMHASGQHRWFTAPSGTAGNTISFTQAMTLDANGNLLVGTTSNPGVLNTSVVVNSGASSLAGLVLQNNATGSTSTDGSHITIVGTELRIVNLENAATLFSNNGSERMRITSAGNIHTPAGATTMTNGFFYIPAAAGVPTGVPTAITGTVPMYYDTTNNKFYVYNGAWKSVTLT